MGSLCAASRMAAYATAGSTPSISNSTLPGRITATHCSGAPLPLPIRVSAGFLVIGLSGKSRIHTLPPRLIDRVIATRAASICRSVTQPQLMAFSPTSPNAIEEPRHALPAMRPRCCFLYLTFLGIIILVTSSRQRPVRCVHRHPGSVPLLSLVLAFAGLRLRRAFGGRFRSPHFLLPRRLRRHQRRQN